MKTTEQYFPVVMFVMLCKEVQLWSRWMKSLLVTIQMKVTEHYSIVVLFNFIIIIFILCKGVLTSKPLNEI